MLQEVLVLDFMIISVKSVLIYLLKKKIILSSAFHPSFGSGTMYACTLKLILLFS